MGKSMREEGLREGTVGASPTPAAQKVVPELSAGRFSMAGRSPPLREQKCGQGLLVRIQVVPRNDFRPEAQAGFGAFCFSAPEKEFIP